MTELKPVMTTREILHTYFKTGETEDDKKIEILMQEKWIRQDTLLEYIEEQWKKGNPIGPTELRFVLEKGF